MVFFRRVHVDMCDPSRYVIIESVSVIQTFDEIVAFTALGDLPRYLDTFTTPKTSDSV